MNKHVPHIKIPHLIAMAAIAGLVAIATNTTQAQMADLLVDQSEFPTIIIQPTDQAVPVGSNAVMSVQAIDVDSYQWQTNGVDILGQTNSTLVLKNVGIHNAGAYSCNVSKGGGDPVPTRTASLSVVVAGSSAVMAGSSAVATSLSGGGPIIVFGLPKPSGGTIGSCPGKYAGYLNFTKTFSQGWGWAPSSGATIFTATDGSGRTDTIITYMGRSFDSGCDQTSVTIPNPPPSASYRFTIYFPNNVPTTNYPIVLTGFDP